MFNEVKNILKISREFIEKNVKEGQIVVDCTLGNGNDTEILLRQIGKNGFLYGFDIQKLAIESTKDRLKSRGFDLENVKLIEDGHENIDLYVSGADFIIYNLGYLPRGDKNIITRENTTIESLKKAVGILNPAGFLLVASYIGHDGGREENLALERFLRDLNQDDFAVLKNQFINQKNNPPILYIIEKSDGR